MRPKNVTVGNDERLVERFETHRNHLRAVAYRMLGSLSEEDDAEQALIFSRLPSFARLALVNGTAGIVVAPRGYLFTAMVFTIRQGKISEIQAVTDPARLHQLDFAVLKD